MICPVTQVYLFCDWEDRKREHCFRYRIVESTISYGKPDYLI